MNRRKTLAAVVALVAAGAIGGLLTGRAKATHFPEPHDPPCGYIELDGNEWVHVDAIRRVTPGRIHLLGAHSQGSPNYVDTSLSIEGVGELIALERAICGP